MTEPDGDRTDLPERTRYPLWMRLAAVACLVAALALVVAGIT